jgi:hypothetical protein
MSKNRCSCEADFIQAISDHSPEAASCLYDTYAATLYKVIYVHVKSPEKAELVLTQTFQYIWNHSADYVLQDQRMLVWMAGIARGIARKAPAITIVYTQAETLPPDPAIMLPAQMKLLTQFNSPGPGAV